MGGILAGSDKPVLHGTAPGNTGTDTNTNIGTGLTTGERSRLDADKVIDVSIDNTTNKITVTYMNSATKTMSMAELHEEMYINKGSFDGKTLMLKNARTSQPDVEIDLGALATVIEMNKRVITVPGKSLISTSKITKLDNIASGATKNSTDIELRNRDTHTGVQPIDTITGLPKALAAIVTNDISDTKVTSDQDYAKWFSDQF